MSGINNIFIIDILFPGSTLLVKSFGIILSSVEVTEIISKDA